MISQRQRHPASSYIGNSQHYLFIIVSDCDNNNLRYMLECNSSLPTYYNAHNYHKSKYMAFLLFGSTLTNSFSSNYVSVVAWKVGACCMHNGIIMVCKSFRMSLDLPTNKNNYKFHVNINNDNDNRYRCCLFMWERCWQNGKLREKSYTFRHDIYVCLYVCTYIYILYNER